uniref:NADH-ubiquinone oxidoreductase chain 2 n=1 Tax=Trigonotylus caelestialium TaxID=881767 RepID=A0A0F6MY69_9HEMI|nr:NADH dehydrogenase subunit 2 [Trigonotylus caelestialium]
MNKTSSKTLFLSMTIMSTLMVLSSSNWITIWMGMEINIMSFIPLMYKSKNSLLSQSSMMYFLTQSMASMIFIIMILVNMYGWNNLYKNTDMNMIIMLSMMMKLGMPPFHMWFPEMMNKMNWDMCMMLMTWQKIAPMYCVSLSIQNNMINMSFIALSTLSGAILGLNHTSIRKIMSYSSMNHMGWIMSCILMYKKLWMMYMILYSVMMIMFSLCMKKYNIMYINQLNIKYIPVMDKINMLIMMLSIGGIPPFLGFLPKWIAMEYMIMSNEIMLLLMMTMSSLITLSYYLRMISYLSMFMSHSQKWNFLSLNNKKNNMYMFYINMILPMIMLLMNFM